MLKRAAELVSRLGLLEALRYAAGRIARGLLLPKARLSYSQFGEDLVARDILGLERGFYVDVGCNDPIRWSNTYLFYLHGWSGILLDGNQQLVDQCRHKRPADTAVCCLLGESEGEGEIAIYDDHALSSAVCTHNTGRRNKARLIEHRKVSIRSLTSVLDEHAAPSQIAFLSIDVEGMDLMVLKGIDFNRYHPQLIAIEDAAFDPLRPHSGEIVTFLVNRGYRLYAHVYPTLFFLAHGVKSKGFHEPSAAGDAAAGH